MDAANLLINSLSPSSRDRLLEYTDPVDLPLRTVLYQAEVQPHYAYFLTSGIASLVVCAEEGGVVEVEVVGCEGVVGAIHLLGPALVPLRCFMQLPGSALRIRFSELRHCFQQSPEICGRILELVQVRALTLGQVAGCHRLHGAEQRFARWLLMVQDRTQQQTLALTQEFMAEMLGSQRTTVSAVAAGYQKNGLIEYSRGHLRILNRPGLERAACGCYAVTHKLLASLYHAPPMATPLWNGHQSSFSIGSEASRLTK